MELNHSTVSMLHMFPHPVFLVKNGIITDRNQAAQQLRIPENLPICELLTTGRDIYESLSNGCLSLTLSIHQTAFLATVHRMEDFDIFHLMPQQAEETRLHGLALAASQLRQPLSDITTVSELLLANLDAEQRKLSGQLNRSLMQMLRMLGNMTDAQDYANRTYQMEMLDAAAVIDEAMEATMAHLEGVGRTLIYKSTGESMMTWADRSMLERAVYNLLSNAVKYSPVTSKIHVELELQNSRLALRVVNTCENVTPEQLGTIFFRYTRNPMVEPGEHGIGLGIPMIRSVAAAHNGTLLLDQPSKNTVRFTMTIAKRTVPSATVRSPRTAVDYSGGRNTCLMELSDILPAEKYED